MGLAVRVIPTLLAKGDKLVKGTNFNAWRVVGHVMQAARIHTARHVDELVILDVSATPEGRGPDLALIEKLAEECFMPLAVGGGIKSVEDARRLLHAGADKIVIGTAAATGRHRIKDLADYFGSQAIVVAIDVRDGSVCWECGRKQGLPGDLPAAWAREAEILGAGEILLTSVDREGTMKGYDLKLVRSVAAAVDIPVIAHGGCSGPENMLEAIQAGAHAVAAGALFQFTETTPRECSAWLARHGVETRIAA